MEVQQLEPKQKDFLPNNPWKRRKLLKSLLFQKLNEFHTVRAQVKRKHILFLLKSTGTELNIRVPPA